MRQTERLQIRDEELSQGERRRYREEVDRCQSMLRERYRLIDDGARMEVEFMVEDPEYLVGSMTHRRPKTFLRVRVSPNHSTPKKGRTLLTAATSWATCGVVSTAAASPV